jgi:hypothetical protein
LQDDDLAEAERRARFERVAANLKEGDLVDGVVTSAKVHCAFVDLGGGFRSQLHMINISAERPSDVRDTFRVSLHAGRVEPLLPFAAASAASAAAWQLLNGARPSGPGCVRYMLPVGGLLQ